MADIKRLGGTALALGLSAGALAVGVQSLSSPASAAGCGLYANAPVETANGTGGRRDCVGRVDWVHVLVQRDISFFPDALAGENKRYDVINVNIYIDGDCFQSGDYYTETRSSAGNKVQSGRRDIC